MPANLNSAVKFGSAMLLWCVVLFTFAGCGKSQPPPADAAKKTVKKPGDTNAPAASTNALRRPAQFLSVFSTNDPRDPFHPKSKAKTTTAATAAAAAQNEADELAKAVQKGFDAIFTFGNERQLILFGLDFAENVERVVPVPVGGTVRRVKIKPVRILATRAELQVEGVPKLVPVTKQRR